MRALSVDAVAFRLTASPCSPCRANVASRFQILTSQSDRTFATFLVCQLGTDNVPEVPARGYPSGALVRPDLPHRASVRAKTNEMLGKLGALAEQLLRKRGYLSPDG
jgi:hypothetical protein